MSQIVYSETALHRMNVLSAAYSYANAPSINLRTLANSFKVNIATILTWIDEALKKDLIMEVSKRDLINDKLTVDLKHQQDVTAASYTYVHTLSSIGRLANAFNVTEVTMSEWLVEAVEQEYLKDEKDIDTLVSKHVNEYERKNHLSNSSLRETYTNLQQAIKTRNERQLAG